MATTQSHCSVNYHRFGGEKFELFGRGVSTGIYTHIPPFTGPPIPLKIDFDEIIDKYHGAWDAYKNGGKSQKGDYLTERQKLMDALDKTAGFVDDLPAVDEAMITLAGYTPTKTGDSKAVIPANPVINNIAKNGKGVLVPECNAVTGAEYYGLIVLDKPIDNTVIFVDGILLLNNFTGFFMHLVSKGRKKTVPNLKSKSDYYFYFYAGNSAGVSGLSDVMVAYPD